jgi:RNA polymerase sigma-70 factor (ECF subfamily)
LSWADECQIEPVVVAALYLEHADELRRFLVGVLRDPHSAGDALQAAFAKLVEQGHTVQPESRKSWLFTVAYREALALRRRKGVERGAIEKLASREQTAARQHGDSPDARLLQWETVERVRAALDKLPIEQREVVRLKILEQKTFAAIAADLNLPLGTVLTRMQLALAKLRRALGNER